MDTSAFFNLTYGLFIVSAPGAGCVINTAIQVTSKPARISVTLSKNNFTTEAIRKHGSFAISVLSESADMGLIGEFGFKTSADTDKFSAFETGISDSGIPYIKQMANAVFICRIVESFDLGTHVMFISDVLDAEKLSDEKSMTYDYYHNVVKGTTPKNAPSYKEESGGFRCTVCGYIAKLDELPEDYVCPICGVGRDKFVKI